VTRVTRERHSDVPEGTDPLNESACTCKHSKEKRDDRGEPVESRFLLSRHRVSAAPFFFPHRGTSIRSTRATAQ